MDFELLSVVRKGLLAVFGWWSPSPRTHANAFSMIDTLFFILQIVGIVILLGWVVVHDRRAAGVLSSGPLAFKQQDPPDDVAARSAATPVGGGAGGDPSFAVCSASTFSIQKAWAKGAVVGLMEKA